MNDRLVRTLAFLLGGVIGLLVGLAITHQTTGRIPTSSLSGATLNVSTRGTDTGACLTPCATLAYATSLAVPGDTVLVQPGTYGPQTIMATGTSTARIIIQGAGVTLTRPSPASAVMQATPLLQIKNSSYLIIAGFTVTGMKGRSDYRQASRPVGGEVVVEQYGTTPSNAIVFSGLDVSDANQTCLKVQDQEPSIQVRNSTFTNCGQPGNGLDHALYITGKHSTAIGNTISGTTGYGIHFHTDVRYATIQNNTVSGAAYAGIIDDANDGIISGNTLSGNAWGMTLAGNEQVTHNVLIQNNVDTGTGQHGYGLLFGGNNHPMSGEVVEHNTFYRDGVEIQTNIPSDGTNSIDSNIFQGRDAYAQAIAPTVPANGDVLDYNDYFSIILPAAPGPHSLARDPLFVNPPSDLHLQPISPLLGQASDGTQIGASA